MAVIGANDRPDSIGGLAFSKLLAAGFRGDVYSVNLKYAEVLGHACALSLRTVEHSVDFALVCTPMSRNERVLRDCAAKGIGHAILLSFNEPPTRERLAAPADAKVLGPGSAGLLRPWLSLDASIFPSTAPKGGLAIVSQSASLAGATTDWVLPNHVGLSAQVSLGAEAGISLEEMVEYLAEDAPTQAILLCIEDVADGPRLLSAPR
ncbi:MAG: CoA-binding protein [Pseudomonadota bacterium]